MTDDQIKPMDELPAGIGNPAHRALTAAGILRLADCASVNEKELLALHGVGPKAIRILKAALSQQGLTFASHESNRRISDEANRQ